MYKFTFTSNGQWSFGVLEKGTYKEIQVRTADGIPVINAIVLIKDDNLYVAVLKGKATNCDGTGSQDGELRISRCVENLKSQN